MDKITYAMKDYLKAIYLLEKGKAIVKTTDLAEEFRIAPASVTEMIQKIAMRGLLVYEPYRGVKLTDEGRRVIMQILRGHRLIEKLLVDFIGMDASSACNEASTLELVVSEKVVNGICVAFNHPEFCPCGKPVFRNEHCCGGR